MRWNNFPALFHLKHLQLGVATAAAFSGGEVAVNMSYLKNKEDARSFEHHFRFHLHCCQGSLLWGCWGGSTHLKQKVLLTQWSSYLQLWRTPLKSCFMHFNRIVCCFALSENAKQRKNWLKCKKKNTILTASTCVTYWNESYTRHIRLSSFVTWWISPPLSLCSSKMGGFMSVFVQPTCHFLCDQCGYGSH